MSRIGVFGGTFDPVHVGHLAAAVNARYSAGLDLVLMVVAGQPWQKLGERDITPAADRFALVQAATEGVEGIQASDIEIRRGGLSYTADTLGELHALHPQAELFVVVGADAAAGMDTWERADEVAEVASIVVVNRPGVARPELARRWRVVEVEMPALDLSSTDLRQRAADGRPLDFLIPAPAIRYIAARSLYDGYR